MLHCCRCPNPTACDHNHTDLAMLHPESNWANKHSWDMYSKLLCDVENGYKGDLCGVCARGYGMTSPFSCSYCQGAQADYSKTTGDLVLIKEPSRGGLSGLYIFYWVALTAWCCLSVWAALPSERATPSSSHASSRLHGSRSADYVGGSAADAKVMTDVCTSCSTPCPICKATPDVVKEPVEPLDVVKVGGGATVRQCKRFTTHTGLTDVLQTFCTCIHTPHACAKGAPDHDRRHCSTATGGTHDQLPQWLECSMSQASSVGAPQAVAVAHGVLHYIDFRVGIRNSSPCCACCSFVLSRLSWCTISGPASL
jgi:hypothetical protein